MNLGSSKVVFKAPQQNKDLRKSDLTMNPICFLFSAFFPFQTDVIVNSVDPLHGLRLGPVSKSILQQAGDELELEFNKKITWIHQGSQLVLVTKGFKLSCQCVCHVLWDSRCFKKSQVSSK